MDKLLRELIELLLEESRKGWIERRQTRFYRLLSEYHKFVQKFPI